MQKRLLSIIRRVAPSGSDGITDDELYPMYVADALTAGWVVPTPQSLRSRRSELVRAGAVRHSGKYGRTVSGRKSRRWVASS
ncbi:hypothetical protein J7E22_10725 [Curtobacterium sp. ISL-83]|nr:hypothetical protein [Curtobacterium sp. ISL-83]